MPSRKGQQMRELRVVRLAGTPSEMGKQHGEKFADDIKAFAQDRLELAMENAWTGSKLSESEVLNLAEACLEEHHYYSPELTEELVGIANAAGVRPAEVVIASGFTDFIDLVYNHANSLQTTQAADDCTAFLIPASRTANQQAMFGQTWDMHDKAEEHVILMDGQPADVPSFLAFSTAGCLGMIGMNSEGIAVGINNLMAADGQVGVSWTHVVRKVLMQEDIEVALACITDAKLMGAHNYLLMDKHGQGYNIEATSTAKDVTPLAEMPIVHTNHCLVENTVAQQRSRPEASQKSSEARLGRAQQLLTDDGISPEDLMDVTRDKEAICVSSKLPMHVATCGAAIMRPATGDFWAVWGKPTENEYQRFSVRA
ncbi:MAG: C45 family peptidase [Deinococcota bacterium]